MNKTITITVIILIFIAGYRYLLKTFDQLPSEYQVLKNVELDIRKKHKSIISKLSQDSQANKKDLVDEYLIDSKLWLIELDELAQTYKKIGKGLSMRRRSRLAGEALGIKNQIKLIKQTQIMLKNALEGKVLAEHKDLLKFDTNNAYRKIFQSIPLEKNESP